jgi:hypothetical protein
MERALVPTDSIEYTASLSINDAAYTQTGNIFFGGIPSFERQNISRPHNTFQLAVSQEVASMRISITLQVQVVDAVSYHQHPKQDMHEFTHDAPRLTLREFFARLHRRSPVVPKTSSADLIRELRDEP